MTPLCELARKYHTDKGGDHFTYGKNGEHTTEICHSYTPIYWDLLRGKRYAISAVLEVGVNAGCSLRMWEEFFPDAMIIGLDNDHGYLFTEGRIACFWADQSDGRTLVKASERFSPYDLIVDDGSHDVTRQQYTLVSLLPLLDQHGVYVVEDMHQGLDPKVLTDVIPPGFVWEVIDTPPVHGKKVYQEKLLVVRHG